MRVIFNQNDIINSFLDLPWGISEEILQSKNTSMDIIDEVANEVEERVKKSQRNNSYDYSNYRLLMFLSSAHTLLPRHIDLFIDLGYFSYVHKRPEVQDYHIDNVLLSNSRNVITPYITSTPSLKKRHIDELMNPNRCYDIRVGLAKREDLTEEHIDILIKDKRLAVLRTVAHRKDLKDHHIEALMEKKDHRGMFDYKIRRNLRNAGYINQLVG